MGLPQSEEIKLVENKKFCASINTEKQKDKREGGVSHTSSCATYELQARHDRTIFDIVQHADRDLEPK